MGLTTKKTHEEFTSLLSDKFPNIITEDIYQTAKIKMKFKCKVDNYEWTTTPDVILRSKGCPKCNRVAKLTNDEFINRIKLNNPNYDNIEILSSYINLKNKIHCKCKIDGYEWDAMPDKLMSNSGCPKCGGTLKLTHNEFVAKLNNSEKFKNIELLSEYEVQRKKIKCRCKVDGHEWFVLPQSLLKGHGCPKCSAREASIRESKTHEMFIKEMELIHPDFEILDTYTGVKANITYKCKICGHIKTTTPDQLLRGDRCQQCNAIDRRLSTEEYAKQLMDKNPNIELISEYNGRNNKIKVKCKTHGCEWFVLPNNAFKTTGCHMCNDTIGEKKVSEVLDSMNIEYLPQYRFDNCRYIRPLPFDFYLPKLNICIEYDGQQHYRPVTFGGCTIEQAIESHENTLMRDNIKNQYCKNNNIKLIRIKYSDYNNIESIIQNAIC